MKTLWSQSNIQGMCKSVVLGLQIVYGREKYSETNFFLEVRPFRVLYEMPNHIIHVSSLNWVDIILTFWL